MKPDLKTFFDKMNDHVYCLVKPDDNLPDYREGADLDIFCYDMEKLSGIIVATGRKYLDEGLEIKISRMDGQMYVDFLREGSGDIVLRFDLYEKLPSYKNLLIKPAFFENILENRVFRRFDADSGFYAPGKIDDCVLRYIEYVEWYGRRPDKIKHIDYIMNRCAEAKERFLEKLHHYTRLPRVRSDFSQKENYKRRTIYYLKKVYARLPDPIKKLVRRIVR